MASLIAMASNLIATASNPIAMASNLIAMVPVNSDERSLGHWAVGWVEKE